MFTYLRQVVFFNYYWGGEMLNEFQIADRLEIFQDLPATVIKKRIRKVIREVGITPYIPERGTWLIPSSYLETIEESLCPLKSKRENIRMAQNPRPTGCVGLSRVKRFSEARSRLS